MSKTYIKNYTGGHSLFFYNFQDTEWDALTKKHKLKQGAKPIFEVKPEPKPLRAETIYRLQPNFSDIENTVPQMSLQTDVKLTDPVPVLLPNEVAVVSFQYMAAAKAAGFNVSQLRTTLPCYADVSKFPTGVIALVLP